MVGGRWIPLHYLVTSEIDFRLSEAVTKRDLPTLFISELRSEQNTCFGFYEHAL